MDSAHVFGYNLRSEVTDATMGTNAYSYDYAPIGDQKSAKPKAQPPGDRDFEAARRRGARRSTPRRSGNCYRLVSACSNNVLLVTNVYDHLSRRIRKEVYVVDSGSWILASDSSFLYDGWNPVRETITNPQSTITNYYTWGLDLSGTLQGAGGAGGLLAVTTVSSSDPQPAVRFPVYDANGQQKSAKRKAEPPRDRDFEAALTRGARSRIRRRSGNRHVTAYLDSTGGVAIACTYDAIGNTVSETGNAVPGTVHLPHRFSTKYADDETGLYYYGYRFYSPELGRWASRDPIGEKGGLNIVGFCMNNGLNYVDKDGRETFYFTADSNYVWPVSGNNLALYSVTINATSRNLCKEDNGISLSMLDDIVKEAFSQKLEITVLVTQNLNNNPYDSENDMFKGYTLVTTIDGVSRFDFEEHKPNRRLKHTKYLEGYSENESGRLSLEIGNGNLGVGFDVSWQYGCKCKKVSKPFTRSIKLTKNDYAPILGK